MTSAYYLKETPSQASAGFRTYDQTSADKQFFPLSDLQRSNNIIITNSNSNLNPSQQSIQKPSLHNEWLEELKRRRKKLGWW